MGYYLHYAKHYAPDWETALGNVDAWSNLYFEKFRDEDDSWNNDEDSEFEVSKDSFKKYIKELLASPDDVNEFYTDTTNAELAADLQNIVDGCQDEVVHMECF